MKQALNFQWSFIADYKDEFLNSLPKDSEIVDIPHSVKEIPYNYFNEEDYQLVSTYQKTFDVKEDIKNKVVKLVFDGYMLKAHIYLNGHDLGKHISGWVKVSLDVTEYIKQKDNILIVVLDSHENNNVPPFGYAVDYLTFSGIYREVNLEVHPKTYLENIFVRGNSKGHVKVTYDKIGGDSKVSHKLLYKEEIVCESDKDEFDYKNAKLWDLDNPHLYTLVTTIESEDGKEEYQTRFGFREAIFKPDGFYLNNKKIKLVGLNRHQSYPYVGYAMPKSIQEDDADILKYQLGINVVRQSHYPQSEHFLNRCDEIGLLTVNEIPGWQHISKEEAWRNQYYTFVEKMVLAQRNHPSLIAHGVRIDESQDDHELYQKGNQIAHQLDETRQTLGVRNFPNSELLEDIYAYNDFCCNSLKQGLVNRKTITKSKGPYLVTEYMGHMDPVKPTSDEPLKVEVALRHAKVIDDNYKYNDIAGAIGWCAFDYYTHVDFGSGDHICPHGALDMFRNYKPTASIYASQGNKEPMLEVISNMKPGDRIEARYCDIYVATNCDYFELYKNDELVTRFYPKRDLFKYLPHPPILIDDIVGDTLKETKLPKKSWRKVAKMLSHAALQGYGNLSKKELLYLYLMSKKYHYNHAELVELFNTYVGSWGGIAKVYKFKGYKNNQLVVTKEVGPSKSFDLKVDVSKTLLENKETYDACQIHLHHIDEHGSLMQYSNRVIEIETEGPIRILGGSHQALIGGQLTIYVLSENKPGQAKVTIKLDNLVKEILLQVK